MPQSLTQSKILVVEDVAESRQMLRQLLSRLGVTILEAHDGREGVERATADRPDLILMDLSLPVMDGWQAIEALKGAPATAGLRIVVVTAQESAADLARARRLGCEGWVTKPIDTAELSQLVVNLLRGEYVASDRRW
jgi:CheY-like chemotaxis protein